MNYRKKLIEVAIPLEAINVASAREKSIRHGHPSTLHLWWARRPLAACRAVLFASLVDDPDSDPTFRKADGTVDEERAGYRRAELFNLIEELVLWENSNNDSVLNRARAEIAASVASRRIHDTKEWTKDKIVSGEKAWAFVCRTAKPPNVNTFLAEHAPPVLDPFCGGGSIPLEAQRLGLRAYGSDLNPVPVLITKALIEIPPKFAGKPPVNPDSNARLKDGWTAAQGLADDVRYYGKWMLDEAKKRIGHLYPKANVTAAMAARRPDLKPYIGEEFDVMAWLWARTFRCSNPSCRQIVPMVTTATISRSPAAYLRPLIRDGICSFEISKEPTEFDGTQTGRGAKFRCPFCGTVNDDSVVRVAAQAGQMNSTLTSAICLSKKATIFLGSSDLLVKDIPVPDVPVALDQEVSKEHRCVLYGFRTFPSLFSARQMEAMLCFSALVDEAKACVIKACQSHGATSSANEYAEAVSLYLAFAVDRAADYWSQMTTWMPRGTVRQTFARQRIAMNWDWVEANPFGEINCAWEEGIEWISKAIQNLPFNAPAGHAKQESATALGATTGQVLVSTDPPYYDNIPYADCSDYFYVWLRNSLGNRPNNYKELLGTLLTPKSEELVASAARNGGSHEKAKAFFEQGLGDAFIEMRNAHDQNYPLTIYYAFKQTESGEDEGDDEAAAGAVVASTGWETMLGGLVEAGLTINGTWPVRTERGARNIGIGTNALASSIVLSCRTRPKNAPLATRREFLNAMKHELPDALKHLQRGSIAPVDLAQAAIGPGMAVFTRYSKVMEYDGSSMSVRQALGLINQALDEVLAEQEGEFDSDTRWALAWFEQFGMEEGAFGIAETLSKAKNSAVNGLQEAGIIRAKSGKVRLLKRDEMKTDWDPTTDKRLTSWEVTQHLIRSLDTEGESAAANLLRRLGGVGEVARDLAYRLYSICERKKWAEEAMAYNSLVVAWPELSRLARATPVGPPAKQTELF